MSADPYGPEVRRLFAAPAHAGTLAGGVVVRHAAQGVEFELSARVSAGRIERLGFRAYGCPHVIAAAEAFCAAWEGHPAPALGEFDARKLMQSLTVPAEKTGRILVLEDTVRMLGAALQGHQGPRDDAGRAR